MPSRRARGNTPHNINLALTRDFLQGPTRYTRAPISPSDSKNPSSAGMAIMATASTAAESDWFQLSSSPTVLVPVWVDAPGAEASSVVRLSRARRDWGYLRCKPGGEDEDSTE